MIIKTTGLVTQAREHQPRAQELELGGALDGWGERQMHCQTTGQSSWTAEGYRASRDSPVWSSWIFAAMNMTIVDVRAGVRGVGANMLFEISLARPDGKSALLLATPRPLAREGAYGYTAQEALDMAMASEGSEITDPIRPLRRAEYDRLVELGAFQDERIELLEGALVQMSPVSTSHCSIVQELTALLVPALAGRATVRIQMPLAALDASEPEPDVALVPLGTYREAHPEHAHLIIEVAESSLRRDRGIKQRIYAHAGVPEYWVINVANSSIEVFTHPTPQGYGESHTLNNGSSLAPRAFPDVKLELSRILG